ncbi:MAG: histidine phosphatase family protein [Candidatus Andersenbacteria bacterium]|nr:histidine phosphatase family protein [bacterium]MDZ4225513.1 histidine phosphatase family protein [Candidatus Andersenbacteria bacterium]
MTNVFFLRHGPTLESQEGRLLGQHHGTILPPQTERYAAAVAPLLRAQKVQLLLSSDLARAQETSHILAKFFPSGIKEANQPLLREKNLGFYEGMRWSATPADFQKTRHQTEYDYRPLGGESDEDVVRRVKQTLKELANRYPNMTVACVTHSGWLQQLAKLAGQDLTLPGQDKGEIVIIETNLNPDGTIKSLTPTNTAATPKKAPTNGSSVA